MKKFFELMQEIYKDNFDVEVLDNGIRKYRFWHLMSICNKGKVVSVGKGYYPEITYVSSDDMKVIDTAQMSEEEQEKYYFIEDTEAYSKEIGCDVSDLIGLSSGKFYAEIEKRLGFTDLLKDTDSLEPYEKTIEWK